MSSTTGNQVCCICKLPQTRLYFRYDSSSNNSTSSPQKEKNNDNNDNNSGSDNDELKTISSGRFPRAPAHASIDRTNPAKVYCTMCYGIEFQETPDDSHSLNPHRHVWTWRHFRDANFSFPTKNEKLSRNSILIINTGGTLSCRADKKTGLLAPEPLFEYLSTKIEAFSPDPETKKPALVQEANRAEIKGGDECPFVMLENPALMIDSTSASFEEWNLLAMIILSRTEYYSGFVIIHGTDTLAYSASALTFSLWGMTAPVVVTGSQTPLRGVFGGNMLSGNTDALSNLLGACDFARHHKYLRGVFVYFFTQVFVGSRVVKMHANAFNGFSSPNSGPVSYYNGTWFSNQRLLRALVRAREEETVALARHVERHCSYYSKYLSCAPLSPTVDRDTLLKAANSLTLHRALSGARFGYSNNTNTNTNNTLVRELSGLSGAASAAAAQISGANYVNNANLITDAEFLASPISLPETPAITNIFSANPSPCIPTPTTTQNAENNFPKVSLEDIHAYYDVRHKSSIQRFHRESHVLVFVTRPGAFSGATALKDMLQQHGRDLSAPLGLVIMSFGGGNAQAEVSDLLVYARNVMKIPVVWTSQCFAGSSSGHYAVGLNENDHGTNVYDMTFEAAYTRLVLCVSQHIFIQTGVLQEEFREEQKEKSKKSASASNNNHHHNGDGPSSSSSTQQGSVSASSSDVTSAETRKFSRSDLYRDAVEDWMRYPHRLCMTSEPSEFNFDILEDQDIENIQVARDSAVAMYH